MGHQEKKIKELSNFQFGLLCTLPVLIFLMVIVIYPLGYALWASFQQINLLFGFQVEFVGFRNYIDALLSSAFWHSLKVSLRFVTESVIFTLLIGLGIALTLAKLLRGSGIIRSLIVLPWAISRYGVGIIFRYFWKGSTGFPTALSYLFGSEESIVLVNQNTVIEMLSIGNAWNMAPFVALFLLANMETIPSRLYDMAEIDHLGPFRKFFYVTLPYLRYTLFVFTAIVTVLSFKVFDFIFVQTGGGPGVASATLTYQIYKESFKHLNLSYGAAISFLLLGLILAATFTLFGIWGRKEG